MEYVCNNAKGDTNIRTTCETCANNYLNLEKIINSQIQARRDDCDVTWETILDGLQKFQINLLAQEVIKFLKKEKAIKKYMKKRIISTIINISDEQNDYNCDYYAAEF